METKTNRIFANEDKEFNYRCQAVGIDPTKRQASRYRNKTGLAYNATYLLGLKKAIVSATDILGAANMAYDPHINTIRKAIANRANDKATLRTAIAVARSYKHAVTEAKKALKEAEAQFNAERQSIRSKAGLR